MKLDQKSLGYISVFEKCTGAEVKDCFFIDTVLYFIVKDIGRAIGKNGCNIKILRDKFKKQIRVVGFSEDAAQFVKNLIYPVEAEVEIKGDKLIIMSKDRKEKGFLFGRDKSKFKNIQGIVKRYFNVEIGIE